MEIVPGNPFYLYIVNLSAKPVNLPKLVLVATAPNIHTFMVHGRGDEALGLESNVQNTRQSIKNKDQKSINAVHSNLMEHPIKTS